MIRTSVIIPVYNTAEYLEEAIDSVLAQDDGDIEVILVDDGSDDGSFEICERYADKYACVSLLQQEHLFQGTARNRGLEAAEGEFVYFMDSDDILMPGAFKRCRDVCEGYGLDFVMFDAEGFRYDENDTELAVPDDIWDRSTLGIEDRVYTGPEFWNSFYNYHGILYVVWLLYCRRSFLLENRLFYEERTYFEDNDWMLRAYLSAEKVKYIPEKMHRHRWRRGSNMLDGFTVDLMKGCFRMHDVLLDIAEGCSDPAKLKMTEDVIRLNIRRFERLKSIVDTEPYEAPLEEFCSELAEKLNDPAETEYKKYQHLAAIERIAEGASGWYRSPLTGIAVPVEMLPVWLPDADIGKLVIYGTGNVGKRYASLVGRYASRDDIEVIFAETDPGPGAMFMSKPVLSIHKAAEAEPDAVVVASTRFTSEMKETAIEAFGEHTKIVTLPKEMRYFL